MEISKINENAVFLAEQMSANYFMGKYATYYNNIWFSIKTAIDNLQEQLKVADYKGKKQINYKLKPLFIELKEIERKVSKIEEVSEFFADVFKETNKDDTDFADDAYEKMNDMFYKFAHVLLKTDPRTEGNIPAILTPSDEFKAGESLFINKESYKAIWK